MGALLALALLGSVPLSVTLLLGDVDSERPEGLPDAEPVGELVKRPGHIDPRRTEDRLLFARPLGRTGRIRRAGCLEREKQEKDNLEERSGQEGRMTQDASTHALVLFWSQFARMFGGRPDSLSSFHTFQPAFTVVEESLLLPDLILPDLVCLLLLCPSGRLGSSWSGGRDGRSGSDPDGET